MCYDSCLGYVDDPHDPLYKRKCPAAGPMTELFRVTLKRGLIGLPDRFKEHTRALALRHTHQHSYLQINPSTVGNILKVKELVAVKVVNGRPPVNAKYWAKGYRVIKSLLP